MNAKRDTIRAAVGFCFCQIKDTACTTLFTAVNALSQKSTSSHQVAVCRSLCIMLVDFEKLRMTGAGKAIAVLTSGGDAQGKI